MLLIDKCFLLRAQDSRRYLAITLNNKCFSTEALITLIPVKDFYCIERFCRYTDCHFHTILPMKTLHKMDCTYVVVVRVVSFLAYFDLDVVSLRTHCVRPLNVCVVPRSLIKILSSNLKMVHRRDQSVLKEHSSAQDLLRFCRNCFSTSNA